MAQLYVVSVGLLPATDEARTQVEQVLARYGDWVRLNTYTWYVHTNSNSMTVYEGLKPVTKDATVVIFGVNPNDRWGNAPKWIWEWFRARGA